VVERDESLVFGDRGVAACHCFVMTMGWKGKPRAQLARVVAPPSHPCERGGGTRRLAFVVHRRPRWSKSTPHITVVKWDGASSRRMCDDCRCVPIRGLIVSTASNPLYNILLTFYKATGARYRRGSGRERRWWWLKTKINDVEPSLMDVHGCAVRLSGWPETPRYR